MPALALAAIVVIGAVSYWPIRANAFIDIDDPIYITANAHVMQGLRPSSIAWAFTTFAAANWHPLTWLSHMLDCQLFGVNPLRHHQVNVLLHIINACLVFGLLRTMTGATWRSAIVAAIFAAHPAHVESVAWAAERKDLLAALFGLISIGCYVRYARSADGLTWYWSTFVALALGLLAKPTVVTWPMVFLLLDYWSLRRWTAEPPATQPRGRPPGRGGGKSPRPPSRRFRWRLIVEKIPFLGLSLVSCVMTFIAQRRGGAVASVEHWPVHQRIANAAVSYLRYLGEMFWPSKLAMFYPLSAAGWPAGIVSLASIVLLAITAFAILMRRRRPYLLFGWLWFLGVLVPMVGLVQVGGQSIADRYLYLPSIGLSVAVIWLIADVVHRQLTRQLAGAVAAGAIIGCTILTQRQVRFWKDTRTLMWHTIAVVPDNAFCRFYLGAVAAQEARADEAIDHFTRAIQLQPNYTPPYIGLGRIQMVVGRFDDARNNFQQAEKLKPEDPWVYWNLGDLAGLQADWPAAAREYRRSLALQPDEPFVLQNLSLSLMQTGDFAEAQEVLRRLLSLQPNDVMHHYQLAVVLFKNGQAATAEHELSQIAHTAGPQMAPQLQWQLAMLALRRGDIEAALPHLREAARLNPNLAPALQNLAWILATHPDSSQRDPGEAVRLAERANELSGKQIPEILDTLAAAYAAAGHFDEARKTATEALRLAEQMNRPDLTSQIHARLDLYQASKPFIDESLQRR